MITSYFRVRPLPCVAFNVNPWQLAGVVWKTFTLKRPGGFWLWKVQIGKITALNINNCTVLCSKLGDYLEFVFWKNKKDFIKTGY